MYIYLHDWARDTCTLVCVQVHMPVDTCSCGMCPCACHSSVQAWGLCVCVCVHVCICVFCVCIAGRGTDGRSTEQDFMSLVCREQAPRCSQEPWFAWGPTHKPPSSPEPPSPPCQTGSSSSPRTLWRGGGDKVCVSQARERTEEGAWGALPPHTLGVWGGGGSPSQSRAQATCPAWLPPPAEQRAAGVGHFPGLPL